MEHHANKTLLFRNCAVFRKNTAISAVKCERDSPNLGSLNGETKKIGRSPSVVNYNAVSGVVRVDTLLVGNAI